MLALLAPSRFVRSFLLAVVALSSAAGVPLLAQTIPVQECLDLGICGQWAGPYDLGVSCALPSCGTSCNHDEIVHAALIPAGEHAGSVIFWTRCDSLAHNPSYKSHVWAPEEPTSVTGIDFPATALSAGGPFCSGHVWMLDASGFPKLLTVGGNVPGLGCLSCGGVPIDCGHNKAIWFDPLAAAWEDDGPADINHGGLWYPTVSLYDTGSSFDPILIGGSRVAGGGCCHQPDHWQTFTPTGTSGSWTTFQDPTYTWHNYPRVTPLSTGALVSFGHDISCEQGPEPSYGGNPSQILTKLGSSWTRTEGPNPNPPGVMTVGGWHYANAVVMQTLVPGWDFDDPAPESQYDLDRVLVFGGTPENHDFGSAEPSKVSAQNETRELLNAPMGPWTVKASAHRARVFSNWVALPDGSLFLVGGQDRKPIEHPFKVYHHWPERFVPGGPTDPGSWQHLAKQVTVGVHPVTGATYSTLRAYHHVALLLPNGSVGVMGGRGDTADPVLSEYPASDSTDTVEVYKPGYFFLGARPRLVQYPTGTISYGSTFCVTTDVAPATIQRACLIGVGSVTHHFDYGQRYIELMVDPGTAPCGGTGQLAVKAPPLPGMAPAGYYLLFLVDTAGRPSAGKFVKVGY